MKVSRHLRLVANRIHPLATKQFEGVDHLVVPMVALMEGVVFGALAEGPELVLESELKKAPQGWDGRPIVLNHPQNRNGDFIYANEPSVLAKYQFGTIFNSRVRDRKLIVEAWLNLEKAQRVEGALDVIEMIQNEEVVPVSVGATIITEEAPGIYEPTGQEYSFIWREITPDHIAILDDSDGACSLEMGCGVPRAATVHLPTTRGLMVFNTKENRRMPKPTTENRPATASLKKAYEDLSSLIVAAGLTDVNLRTRLMVALTSVDPHCLGIEAVNPEEKTVDYASLNVENYTIRYLRRTYTLDEEGKATVSETPEDVVRMVEFVLASENGTGNRNLRPPCGCGGVKPNSSKGEVPVEKKERIKAILDSGKTSFTKDDEVYLNTLSDERLTSIEEEITKPEEPKKEEPEKKEPPVAAAPVVEKKEEPKKPVTAQEYIDQAPAEVREALSEGVRAAAARRTALVKVLKDSGRCPYNDKELGEMSLEALQKMVKLAGVKAEETTEVDFSAGSPLPRVESSKEDEVEPVAGFLTTLGRPAASA